MKTGDIIRNPWCPSHGNPTRVGLILKANGKNSIVMYPNGTVGEWRNAFCYKIADDSGLVKGFKEKALELLAQAVAATDDSEETAAITQKVWEKEYGGKEEE